MTSFVVCLSFLIFSLSRADEISNKTFPANFKLGVATASYQIEGAWNEDGKGVHLWDWYTHTYPERIENNYNGDVACDSYHKWQEDVELLKDLGVDYYRLSISWSRILPQGTSNIVNQKGVAYYRNLFQALLDANITPLVTLSHWDLPLPIHQMGGWTNPLIAEYFGEYARVCFREFGDLIKDWITINEPETTCIEGYGNGNKAPGFLQEAEGVYLCAYGHVLSHATAYHIYDKEFRATQKGRVAIVLDTPWLEPASNKSEDIEAATVAREFWLGLYANPIYLGNWPQIVIDRVGNRSAAEGYSRSRLPVIDQETIDFINGTYDFFAINTYGTQLVSHNLDVNESTSVNASWELDMGASLTTNSSWKSVVNWVNDTPWGLRKLINYIWNTYNQPEIVVTENGWADLTGDLNDTDRKTYIEGHISAVLDAIYKDNVTVTGYTVWSFMDNFEWTHGYNQKLGLYQVNFTDVNRNRTAKDSAKWFKNVIANRCLVKECVKIN